MEFNVTRDRDGNLQAETAVPLGADRRELRITTRRNNVRKSLCCRAAVVQVSADGRSYTHAFGLGAGCGDYSVLVLEERGARATEKAIRAMHSTALAIAPRLLEQARAHYARQGAVASA